MLKNNEHGYAVMSKNLDAYSFTHIDFETCKKYCSNGDVVARQIPYKSGVSISIKWIKPYKWFEFKRKCKRMNIGWIYITWDYNYDHMTGEVVYCS